LQTPSLQNGKSTKSRTLPNIRINSKLDCDQWKVPGQAADQRKLAQRLWKKTVRHTNWTGKRPWIVIDGESR